MSEKTGKRLKIISTIVLSIQTVAFLAFAFRYLEANATYSLIFAALALVSAVLIVPFVKISDASRKSKIEDEEEQEDTFSLTDMYAPSYIETMAVESVLAEKLQKVDKESDSLEDEMETKQVQIPMKRPSPKSEDFTREFGAENDAPTEEVERVAEAEAEEDDSASATMMLERPSFNAMPAEPAMSKATISAGGLHTVAVKESGTVLVTGYNNYGQCNVEEWDEVIAVSAGSYHTAALFFDGTCAAVGYNGDHQCDVGSWKNICNIATGVAHTVGLTKEGTCVATGDNTYGQCNVRDWENIVDICAGYNCTIGLCSDGMIISAGFDINIDGTRKWSDIVSIAAGRLHLVGLKKNGTCVAIGNNSNGQCDVSRWSGIKEIAAGNYHTVGLTKDGTCIATGCNGYGQCNVHKWTGIKAISAGRNHTVALNKYGRVLAVGDNSSGQCDTNDFEDVSVAEDISGVE